MAVCAANAARLLADSWYGRADQTACGTKLRSAEPCDGAGAMESLLRGGGCGRGKRPARHVLCFVDGSIVKKTPAGTWHFTFHCKKCWTTEPSWKKKRGRLLPLHR